MSDSLPDVGYSTVRQLPRHPTHILRELSSTAQDFAYNLQAFLGGFDPHAIPAADIEAKIARAGRGIIELTDELRTYDRRIVGRAVWRHIDKLADQVRRSFERWGWDKYLGADGMLLLAEAMKRHREGYEIPYLQANLAWRSHVGVENNEDADKLADRAEALGIRPSPALAVDEAKALTVRLKREWLSTPALGPNLPSPTPEEAEAVRLAMLGIGEFAVTLISPYELEEHCRRLEAAHKDRPAPLPDQKNKGEHGQVTSHAKPRRRGRRPDTDFIQDRKIWEAWETKHYKSYAELDLEMGLRRGDVKRAIDRERKRRNNKPLSAE